MRKKKRYLKQNITKQKQGTYDFKNGVMKVVNPFLWCWDSKSVDTNTNHSIHVQDLTTQATRLQ